MTSTSEDQARKNRFDEWVADFQRRLRAEIADEKRRKLHEMQEENSRIIDGHFRTYAEIDRILGRDPATTNQ